MKRNTLTQKGRSFMELLIWVVVAVVLGWLGWQLYQHPESLNPRPESHHSYEDTHP